MEEAKEALKRGRECGQINEFETGLRYFQKAATLAPSWCLPYLFSGVIYLQTNQLMKAESMIAIARTVAKLPSHPPLKQHLIDRLLRAEITCRQRLSEHVLETLPEPFSENYPSTCHLAFSPEVFADDVVQTGSFPHLLEECVITEKLDGGNCCFDFSTGLVYARTHSHEATHDSFGPVKTLFRSLRDRRPNVFEFLESRGLRLFGENMFGVHSIAYKHISSSFYIFGAYGAPLISSFYEDSSPRWLSWNEVVVIAELLSLPTVPVVHLGPFLDNAPDALQRLLASLAQSPSALSRCPLSHPHSPHDRDRDSDATHLPEGFVIRTARSFSHEEFSSCMAKYVRKNHVQTDPSWRRTWQKASICQACVCQSEMAPEDVSPGNALTGSKALMTSVPFLKGVISSILKIRSKVEDIPLPSPEPLDANIAVSTDSDSDSEKLIKFPRTSHLIVAGKGLGVSRDDLLLEGPDKAVFFNTPVVVQEKVDGANIGISLTSSYEVRVQNRSHFVCGETGAQFKSLDGWVERHRAELMQVLRPGRDILYGEWLYARHSVPYDGLPDYFMAFDLYDRREERFLSVSDLEERLKNTSIAMVPKVGIFEFESDQDILQLLSLPSSCCKTINSAFQESSSQSQQLVEGVYLRVEKNGRLYRRSKVVREDFIQTINDGEHWSRRKLEKNKLVI